MASTSTLVVTSCTARKRGAAKALTLDHSMVGGSLASTAATWRAALAKHSSRIPAHALYAGRSFSDAKNAAAYANGDLYIVSAGLGVVAAHDEVPAYDVTAADSGSGLNAALDVHAAEIADWWSVLCDGRGVAHLISTNADSLVLLALPASYVRMIAADLSRVPEGDLQRVRVFTSCPGRAALPSAAVGSAMPYDDRLETMRSYAGTRADFPQRALRHFVERLQGHRLSLAAAHHAVDQALSPCTIRHISSRVRMDNEHLRQLIRTQWLACEGKSTRLLRFLRDEAQVACEQGRFAQLWREVRDELNGQGPQREDSGHALST